MARRATRRFGALLVVASTLFTAALAALVLLNVVAWWASGGARSSEPSQATGRAPAFEAALRAVYDPLSKAEMEQLLAETWSEPYRYEPWVGFRERPRAGRFVNVSEEGFRFGADGDRRLADGALRVFVLGGSTTFGYGVADDQTIPAHLERLLRERYPERDVRVFNFGRGHYFSGQEAALLLRLLAAGEVPDLAIFVDGYNEGQREPFFTPQMSSLFDTRNEEPRSSYTRDLLVEQPLMQLLRRSAASAGPPGERVRPYMALEPAELERAWAANRETILALGGGYGFETLFFLQPIAGYRNPHLEHALQGRWYVEAFDRIRAKVEALEGLMDGERSISMTHLLEHYEAQPFVDSLHYTPEVNARVAGFIAEHVRL